MVNGNVAQIVQLAFMISAILGAAFLIIRAVTGANRAYRRWTGLYELLAGTPADGENLAKPGLNSRLRALENWTTEHDSKLEAYFHPLDELKANGGSSIKDQITRLEATLEQIREQVDGNTRALRSPAESVDSTST